MARPSLYASLEHARRAVEGRALAEEAVEAMTERRLELERRVAVLRGRAGPARRLISAVAGSSAWHLAAEAARDRAGFRPAIVPPPEQLPRSDDVQRWYELHASWLAERDRVMRLVRQADVLERGTLGRVRRGARGAWHATGARVAPSRAALPQRRVLRVRRLPRGAAGRSLSVVIHGSPLPALRLGVRLAWRAGRVPVEVLVVPSSRAAIAPALRFCGGENVFLCSSRVRLPSELPERLASLLNEGERFGAVAAGVAGPNGSRVDGAWSFELEGCVPRPYPTREGQSAAVGGTCIVVRRALLEPLCPEGPPDPVWGIQLSVALAARGWGVALADELEVRSAGRPAAIRSDDLLRGSGPVLRRRVLSDLIHGGGRWCARTARVELDPSAHTLASACHALGWQTKGKAADLRLSVEDDGDLCVDTSLQGDRFPARVPLSAHDAPEALLDAVRSALSAPSVCVRIAVTSETAASSGGDRHLAAALCRALSARGHEAAVRHATDDPASPLGCLDVELALRGRRLPGPAPGQLSVMWLISHPEDVPRAELDRYDAVLVASREYTTRLETELSAPVEAMLQFTDREHFSPRRGGSRHPLLYVGNWRGEFRRAVWDALQTGLRPALYGKGWERLAPACVVDSHVAYEELPALYSSCDVLLADHWDDMRERGFVANRIYDALACEAFVITDRVAGIEAELGDVVETYSGAADLRAKVDHWLAHPDERRERARRGRELVLERHTAEHRARQLVEVIERLSRRADAPAGARSGGDSAPAP